MVPHRRFAGSAIPVRGLGRHLRLRPPALAVALALAAAVLLLGGCAREHVGPSRPAPAEPTGAGSRRVGLQPAPVAGTFDRPANPPTAPGFEVGGLPNQLVVPDGSPPVRLAIPAIGVGTPLLRLGLEPDRSMEVPGDFDLAGWFAEGPAPGQPGPAVIAGHVDSKTGPAVFYRLRELRAGDRIDVTRADGSRLRFVVDTTQSFPKAEFPTAAVFGPTPEAELRLVTCAGAFDRARGSYRDNLVVFARLVGTDGRNQG
jgi:sortase (surface protein transpeptidase)